MAVISHKVAMYYFTGTMQEGLFVERVAGIGVVGNVADARQFRDSGHQGFLDAFLERDIHHAAALTAASTTQHAATCKNNNRK